MKTIKEIKSMLFARLVELENGQIKIQNLAIVKQLSIELSLLYEILGEDVEEEYWERIEHQIS